MPLSNKVLLMSLAQVGQAMCQSLVLRVKGLFKSLWEIEIVMLAQYDVTHFINVCF